MAKIVMHDKRDYLKVVKNDEIVFFTDNKSHAVRFDCDSYEFVDVKNNSVIEKFEKLSDAIKMMEEL